MRGFVLAFCCSFALASPAAAQGSSTQQQYVKLSILQSCTKRCATESLKKQSQGLQAAEAERGERICRMGCNEAFNREGTENGTASLPH